MLTPTHRQLAMFRTVMLHGNLSRAAEVLASSQPTLSRELARLEQVLGFALFDRIGGRLRPTVRALELLKEVERSFVGLEQIAARAHALRSLTTGHLRLACLPALAHALVPHALVRFAKEMPNATVSIHPEESPWLEQAMGEQRFDLGLSETTEAPPSVTLHTLLRVNEVAVLPPNHMLCGKAVLEPQDFEGERFVSLASGDPYRQLIDDVFATAGVTRNTWVETASAVGVCALVRQGLGVAIVNPLTALELSGPELTIKPLSVDIAFTVSLLLPELVAPHPLRAVLVDAVIAAAQALGHRVRSA